MAQTSAITVSLTMTDTRSADLEAATSQIVKSYAIALANGTGAGQADRQWSDTRTLAASANESLDLSGALANLFGTVTFAKVKAIIIKAADGNTNNVEVSRPANGVPIFAAEGDKIAIGPGGIFVFVFPGAGVTVTAGTGDLINLANSGAGTGVTYDITVLGTSA